MKLKDTFITHMSGDEHIMVAVEGFSGMVRSNKTAAFIIERLKKPVTLEQLTDAVAARYDAPRDVIAGDVARVVEQLRSIGAIEE